MKRSYKILAFVLVLMFAMLACEIPDFGGSGSGDGNILFEDDFSRTSSGWDQFSDESVTTDYKDDGYLIGVYIDTYLAWANPYKDYGDAIVEVDILKVSGGDDNMMGIICRHKDVENFYALVFGTDGLAAIRKRFNGSELEVISNGGDWVEGPSIKTGDAAFNHARAECVGSRLSLYVNGDLVVEVNDPDILSGDVGLIAGTFDIPSVEFMFDNFVVTKP